MIASEEARSEVFAFGKRLAKGKLCDVGVWIEDDVCVLTCHFDHLMPSRKNLDRIAQFGLEQAELAFGDSTMVKLLPLKNSKFPGGRSYHISRPDMGEHHLSGIFMHIDMKDG